MTSIYTKKTMKNSYSLPIQSSSLLYYIAILDAFFCLGFFQNSQCFIKNGCIVQHHQTSIRTWFQMNAYAFALLEVMTTEEIAYGFY